jgi:glycosyltransferase involved in cell wall biosynthesis
MGTIVVDSVFFQLNSTGIGRVWRSLLERWSKADFASRLVVLDRAGTAPKFNNIRYLGVPDYQYRDTESDRRMLQQTCDRESASLFISTYYTTPISTPSVFMAYDMIPEVAGLDFAGDPQWREKQFGVRHAKRFIAISRRTADDLRHFFPAILPQHITVAHCGTDFSPPSALRIAAFKREHKIDRPYFLLCGTRGGYKNAGLFFKAFERLGDRRANVAVVCCGGGPDLEPEFAKSVGPAQVRMLKLSDEELQAAYAGARALVYPSLYEGFGMPVIEAMACGCPVITCPGGSIPEVAGDAAIMVGGQDVGAMVLALAAVREEPRRGLLIKKGFERAKNYSWQTMADQVQDALIRADAEIGRRNFPDDAALAGSTKLTVNEALERALIHYNAGEIDVAGKYYRGVLAADPENFDAIHMLALLAYQRNNLVRARRLIDRAIALSPDNPYAHNNLGVILEAQGAPRDACRAYERAIWLNPGHSTAEAALRRLKAVAGA